jgi:tRNA dimethylallyltransferase
MQLKRLQFRVSSNAATVLVVAGPTGAGKTAHALELARKHPEVELVNADSVQIYKGLQIGSNKGDLIAHHSDLEVSLKYGEQEIKHKPQAYVELPRVPVWLLDVLHPNQELAVSYYQDWARAVIADILRRGKTPLLVGGSGLYLNAALFDYNFANNQSSNSMRFELPESVTELKALLQRNGIDFSQLNNSDSNNPRRLQNLYLRQGAPQFESTELKPLYNLDVYLLEPELAELKLKLIARAREMLAAGLVAEAESLQREFGQDLAGQLQVAAGYRQVFTKAEPLAEAIAKSHIKLARKQLIWNKKYLTSASRRTV